MVSIGRMNSLKIVKRSIYGLFLDGEDLGEILLPKRFVPDDFTVGEPLDVFVHLDSEDRLVATTQKPKAMVGEFAYLKLKSVEPVGVFMDWGLDKDLFVHYTQQTREVVPGESYLVYLYLDESGRISASMRTNKFLKPLAESSDLLGKKIKALLYAKTDLGYKSIINNQHDGLLYHSEVFENLELGTTIDAYINKIRPDGKTDLILKNSSGDSIDDIATQILTVLSANKGSLKINDKSSSEEISKMFKVSRKKFKTALAGLYSKRIIKVTETGIELVKKP
ncbi:MAG: GntR family transcriptional regulator [Bdellovibrionaceae bacterium]|nr:GntR family transcriptional regulator [Pseudobdellovibrionaceae bacterium]